MTRILIVENKITVREMKSHLDGDRYDVSEAYSGSEALPFLQSKAVDVLIMGMKLFGGDGIDLLKRVKAVSPLTEIVMIVDRGCVDVAVQAVKLGAFDCLTRPLEWSDLNRVIEKAHKSKRLREGKTSFAGNGSYGADEFVGISEGIQEVRRLISFASPSKVPVLILGETGTGKELVARAIHQASDRFQGPFVAINASALPESLLASELFGCKKGAFTGAISDKAGLLHIANGGTFFIDEVGDMDPIVQARLLRVIETGVFRKLGDTRESLVDVRFVSATNKDLLEEVRTKRFRADLFYRLSTFIINIQPLRDRKEDIPLLVDYLLSRISEAGTARRVSSEALDLLAGYQWPGNVRELLNMLERASLLSSGDGLITVDKLPTNLRKWGSVAKDFLGEKNSGVLLDDMTRVHIERVLEATGGNKSQAARLLGISRSTLDRRLGCGRTNSLLTKNGGRIVMVS